MVKFERETGLLIHHPQEKYFVSSACFFKIQTTISDLDSTTGHMDCVLYIDMNKASSILMQSSAILEKFTLKGKIGIHLKQQLEDEKRYWREVLRRVVECLKFLCSRGLALRGDSEEIGDFSN